LEDNKTFKVLQQLLKTLIMTETQIYTRLHCYIYR